MNVPQITRMKNRIMKKTTISYMFLYALYGFLSSLFLCGSAPSLKLRRKRRGEPVLYASYVPMRLR
jgi:hypothetical protein